MTRISSFFLVTLLLFEIFVTNGEMEMKKEQKKALFVFGDSLYDPGNNAIINKSVPVLHWPYGETYFKHPTGRFSDGRIVPDFIATCAKLPILSPYLHPHPTPFTYGANFASGGAGVILSAQPDSINLPTQMMYFKAVVKSVKKEVGDKRVFKNAVYVFSIGGNDYMVFHAQNPNATRSHKMAFVNQVVANLTTVFKMVYSVGGRKIAYQNVGPMGCSPLARVLSSGACDQELMEMSRQHNNAISNALNKLQTELPGFRYSLFDYYNALKDRINNPSKYGFKEGKRACCGYGPLRRAGCGGTKKFKVCRKPREYIWFDFAHPVERVNFQIANLLWSAPPNVTGPFNVKQFFGSY